MRGFIFMYIYETLHNMQYVFMLIAGILGVLIHVLVKIKSMNKRLDSETYHSIWKAYWQYDFISVILSCVGVITFVFIYDELPAAQQRSDIDGGSVLMIFIKLITSPKTAALLVGYCANSIIDTFLGGTEKRLKQQAAQLDNSNPA